MIAIYLYIYFTLQMTCLSLSSWVDIRRHLCAWRWGTKVIVTIRLTKITWLISILTLAFF